jgi:mRNA-degrading endonuclease toxin of MazEF toxin-antitoxin module
MNERTERMCEQTNKGDIVLTARSWIGSCFGLGRRVIILGPEVENAVEACVCVCVCVCVQMREQRQIREDK